jgi:hypothetical protein
MVEIVLTFFTVIKIKGNYVTDKKTIAYAYLFKGFVLDAFLAFPI